MKKHKKIALTLFILQILIFMCACSTDKNTPESTSQSGSVISESSSLSDNNISSKSSEISSGENVSVKTILFTVVVSEDDTRDFTISTEAATLQEALEQEGLIEGDESSYGLFVTTVDGVTADDSKQEWWCLTKDGEEWVNGVSTTEIADGDKYEFTLKTGY